MTRAGSLRAAGYRLRGRIAVLILVSLSPALLVTPSTVEAQGFFGRYRESSRSRPLREGLPELPGGFTFCRLWYTQVRREAGGLGWSTDYPRADQNLTRRLSELTMTPVTRWLDGEPGIAGVRPTDPNLYQCPFLFASDAGTAGFDASEVEALREYFLKGGFLWVDDFWGNRAWSHFTGEMARVCPSTR